VSGFSERNFFVSENHTSVNLIGIPGEQGISVGYGAERCVAIQGVDVVFGRRGSLR